MITRIQRQRTPGWRMPPGAIYIGRPSAYANPYGIGEQHPDVPFTCPMNRDQVIALFRRYAAERLEREPGWLEPLRDQTLACWDPLDVPCHGDVIAELIP